jgi:predicted dehydrogenase
MRATAGLAAGSLMSAPRGTMQRTTPREGRIGAVHAGRTEYAYHLSTRYPGQDYRSFYMADAKQGGGCLLDYASHVIDLINDILSPVAASKGSLLKSVYSGNVEDAVYSLLELDSGVNGVLSVNWSDDTYRKMSTSVTVIGTKGKVISDANELKVYFKDSLPNGYSKGWNVKYITELTEEVDFYLRGEEYSAQIDYFVKAALGTVPNKINTFESALNTDRAISIIKHSSK